MERIKVRREIKIERNVIERFLMYIKNFIKNNSKVGFYLFLGTMAAVLLLIFGLLYIEKVSLVNRVKYEKILGDYREYLESNNKTDVNKIIKDFLELTDSTYFGFVHEMSYYGIGNIYFSEKQYKKAMEYLLKYEDLADPSLFSALALQKAAVAAEEINDLPAAIEIYKKLENDYGDSIIADQIYYNLGRIYGKSNDIVLSTRNYRKVISSFPNSIFVGKAKKMLFLSGLKRKK